MICARELLKKTEDPARYPLELENGGFLLALERHGRFGEKFEAGSVNVVTFTYKQAHLDSDLDQQGCFAMLIAFWKKFFEETYPEI